MRTGHARPWRKGSTYSDPPRNQLDRGQRHLWRRRVVAEARSGKLPGKAILTAEALLTCMGEDGQLYPSHQALAEKAGVGLRTVARHLERMEAIGLLTRIRRLVRRPWPEGGRGAVRVEQTSNAYMLTFPRQVVTARCRRPTPRNTGCHVGPVEADRRSSPPPTCDRMAALAALEAVRVRRSVALAQQWNTRR